MFLRNLPAHRQPYGLQTISEYREAERTRRQAGSVEWETLELRVHPPNVEVDNENFTKTTLVQIDSANRPGTLIEVVQCLTELGLNIDKARVSSDGGWFVDEFHITEADGKKVTNQSKLAAIRKVLSIDFEAEQVSDDSNQVATVFELAGTDRCGLLADVIQLLTTNGCEVRSAAVWTYNNRVAFVVGVVENDHPIKDPAKLNRLRQLLMFQMDSTSNPIVNIQAVGVLIHHERRLHHLMLLEEQRWWKQNDMNSFMDSSTTATSSSSGASDPISSPTSVLEVEDVERAAMDKVRIQVASLSLENGHGSMDGANGHSNGLPALHLGVPRSAKHSTPEISITECKLRSYWLVHIKCRDRVKLLFDTVCTLADLDFNIYHATIDTENGFASQLYYIRPRFGDYVWDDSKVQMLKYMLDASIQRRFPKGLKVHVHTFDPHSLAHLTQAFKQAGLAVTRGKVRPHLSEEGGHTFYLMDGNNTVPDPGKVNHVLQTLGGKYADGSEEMRSAGRGAGVGHAYPFCYALRAHDGLWTGNNSPASSIASA